MVRITQPEAVTLLKQAGATYQAKERGNLSLQSVSGWSIELTMQTEQVEYMVSEDRTLMLFRNVVSGRETIVDLKNKLIVL